MSFLFPDATGKGPSMSIPHIAKGMGELMDVTSMVVVELQKRASGMYYTFSHKPLHWIICWPVKPQLGYLMSEGPAPKVMSANPFVVFL